MFPLDAKRRNSSAVGLAQTFSSISASGKRLCNALLVVLPKLMIFWRRKKNESFRREQNFSRSILPKFFSSSRRNRADRTSRTHFPRPSDWKNPRSRAPRRESRITSEFSFRLGILRRFLSNIAIDLRRDASKESFCKPAARRISDLRSSLEKSRRETSIRVERNQSNLSNSREAPAERRVETRRKEKRDEFVRCALCSLKAKFTVAERKSVRENRRSIMNFAKGSPAPVSSPRTIAESPKTCRAEIEPKFVKVLRIFLVEKPSWPVDAAST